MIYESIQKLIKYAERNGLITADDEYVVRNQLMEILQLSDWEENNADDRNASVETLLEPIISYAVEKGLIQDTAVYRDLFDTKIMGVFTPFPHEVNAEFQRRLAVSPKEATDWYFDFSKKLNYVRAERIARDMKWTYDSEYGVLDITYQPLQARGKIPGISPPQDPEGFQVTPSASSVLRIWASQAI